MMYRFATDATDAHIEADTVDDAAIEFAADEGLRGVYDLASLADRIDRVGGWLWVEDENGVRLIDTE